jgi:hypothetical protein
MGARNVRHMTGGGPGQDDRGGGQPAWDCPKAGGSGQRFRWIVKQGRKAADQWVPQHSSSA